MKTLSYEFVEYIPDQIEEGKLYVSIPNCVAIHKCCCGCHTEVVTPLSPDAWRLIFDGESISLYPSIGNWQFACKSHYWIKNNTVEWAKSWDDTMAEKNRSKKSNKKMFSKFLKHFSKKKK